MLVVNAAVSVPSLYYFVEWRDSITFGC